jgi:hypothetical protein
MDENTDIPALSLEDIKAAIGELKTSLKDEILGEMNRTVTGAMTKLKKSQETDFSQLVQEQVTSVLGDALKPLQEGQQTPAAEAPADQEAPKDSTPDIQALIQQAIAPYQQAVEAARQQAVAEKLNSAKATARSSYLAGLAGKVNNPKLFMTALETEKGAIFDPETQAYGIPGKDEFQNATFTPLSQVDIDELLKSEDFGIFKPARPGSGLNGAPGQNPPAPKTPTPLSPDPVSRFAGIKGAEDPMAAILANLESAAF